ncbi:MAG: succinate dehydrogenase assembly factor 2 [Burkholderiaceae bacterium]|nr:succinate dehydrogenase assembly factor 2 [Burkholderiaceae bacterium]
MTDSSRQQPEAGDAAHQADAVRRRRLRWRARRGLLENDLVMARFFERYETRLSDADVAGLDALLQLPDNELLDLILRRCELTGEAASPEAQRVLGMLREV